MQPALPDIFHVTLGLVQVTPHSEADWAVDLSQYLQDEDPDSYAVSPVGDRDQIQTPHARTRPAPSLPAPPHPSPLLPLPRLRWRWSSCVPVEPRAPTQRVAAQQLLDELLDAYGKRALPPLLQAVQARLAEARTARAAHAAHWWRLQEAATVGLSIGACELVEASRAAQRKGGPLLFSPTQAFTEVLLPDSGSEMPPLLRARALCTAARFAAELPSDALQQMLHALLAALDGSQAHVLRLAACRSLVTLGEVVSEATLAPAVVPLLPPLVALLHLPSEDATLLTLHAIGTLLRCNGAAAAEAEPWLSPILLQVRLRVTATARVRVTITAGIWGVTLAHAAAGADWEGPEGVSHPT